MSKQNKQTYNQPSRVKFKLKKTKVAEHTKSKNQTEEQ